MRGSREGTLKDRGPGRSKEAKGEENFRAAIAAREFKLTLSLSGSWTMADAQKTKTERLQKVFWNFLIPGRIFCIED